jgi:hypothetical protein
MGLLDFLTGGENNKAQANLQQALAQMQGVTVPTVNDLQLTPLQQYYETGQLPASVMEASEAGPSSYNSQNLSKVPMSTMQQVLARLDEIGAAGAGMTPQEQAAVAEAESNIGRNVSGQRGAISADFAQRGVPQALIAAALQNQNAGQEAQAGYKNALDARAAAAANAQNALTAEGGLAGQMFDKQAGQANTISAANDALSQFNAANRQQAGMVNQAANQTANIYNTTNKQNLANENITGENQRQLNNQVTSKTTAAQLALQKAGGVAGVNQAQAAAHTAAGQQEAGLWGGLIGAGATMGAGSMAKGAPIKAAAGGEIPEKDEPRPVFPAINFLEGGAVPGQAQVPGDSERNDTVSAKLSPGEFVVPRSAMARPDVRSFLANNVPTPRPPADAHPSDVASLLKALHMLRNPGAA